MPLPPGFTLEQAPTVNLPPGFQLETPPAPAASGLEKFGRAAASLADVAIGTIPAAAQQLTYPFYRAVMPAEQAQAASQAVLPGLQQPVGRAFGVTETPEYKGEASRQVLDFVGTNIGKGVKWVSEKLGLPEADVANMAASLSLAAPGAARATVAGARPMVQEARMGAEMALAPGRAERLSAAGYARGPQIDAAAEAQRLGIALNPTDIQPGVGTRAMTLAAGERGATAIAETNKANVRRVALNDMGLPDTAALNEAATFDKARANVAGPYDRVKALPTMAADQGTINALEGLRPSAGLIGKEAVAKRVNKLIDDAVAKVNAGMDGATVLENIRTLRKDAQTVYKGSDPKPWDVDRADTQMAIANQLESMIDGGIKDPKLLAEFRDARQKMARIYAYENATDLNTGMVDVNKLARITAKDNALTGDIASLGQIGGNFPEAFSARAATPWTKLAHIGRTGAAGSLGGLGGYAVGGYPGAIIGSLAGAGLGELGQIGAASRIASPGYQRGLQIYDPRIPVSANQLAQQVAAQNALVSIPPEVQQRNALTPTIVLNNMLPGR